MDPLEARLRRNREVAGRFLMVGIVLLMVFGFGMGFSQWLGSGGGGAMVWIFVSGTVAGTLLAAILVLCATSTVVWLYWGWRLRRAFDPWAYDRELDGPDPERPWPLGSEPPAASSPPKDGPAPPGPRQGTPPR